MINYNINESVLNTSTKLIQNDHRYDWADVWRGRDEYVRKFIEIVNATNDAQNKTSSNQFLSYTLNNKTTYYPYNNYYWSYAAKSDDGTIKKMPLTDSINNDVMIEHLAVMYTNSNRLDFISNNAPLTFYDYVYVKPEYKPRIHFLYTNMNTYPSYLSGGSVNGCGIINNIHWIIVHPRCGLGAKFTGETQILLYANKWDGDMPLLDYVFNTSSVSFEKPQYNEVPPIILTQDKKGNPQYWSLSECAMTSHSKKDLQYVDTKDYIINKYTTLGKYIIGNRYTQTYRFPLFIKGIKEIEINQSHTNKYNLTQEFYCYQGEEIPYFDTSNVWTMSGMFYNNYNLKTIPEFDTSSCTTFNQMFQNCTSLKTIPKINTSKGTNFEGMFYGCDNLESVPDLDTSNGLYFRHMFFGCRSLKTAPKMDFSKAKSVTNMFNRCLSLETVPKMKVNDVDGFISGIFLGCPNLKNVGGFTGLKYALDLIDNKLITVESIMNIINEADEGVPGYSTIRLPSGYEGLTDEQIAVATNKGWTLLI